MADDYLITYKALRWTLLEEK